MKPYSLLFVLFVLVLLVAYRLACKPWARGKQWVVLLVGSLGFYAWCDWRSLGFLFVTSFSVWFAARRMGTLNEECARKASTVARKEKKALRKAYGRKKWHVLLATLALDLGILGYLKYWNVFLGYFNLGDSPLASHLLLPLGISFYTFTTLGYLIDVYNDKFAPEGSYPRFLLFASWFPQLIQGPINKWDQVSKQLLTPNLPDFLQVRRALLLIGLGALKKYVIADTLAGVISNCLDHLDYGTPGCVIVFGIVMYSFQQYGDFSGGIDMVEGVSELFGVRMAKNFNQPYFSTSLAEFWRRWHMSLGEWMRSYVFYPLAVRPSMRRLNKWGTRRLGKEVGRTLSACVANVAVFLLVGLWHGAQAHYVLWGLYNGLIIAFSDFVQPFTARLNAALHVPTESFGWRVFRIARTFVIVNIGRYFDRLVDPGAILLAFKNTVINFAPQNFDLWLTTLHPTAYYQYTLMFACAGIAIVFVVDLVNERTGDVLGKVLALPLAVRPVLYTLMGALIVLSFSAVTSGGGFLYANF